MHSPLPDASALEAGILEDETPSRLSRVQDNVRNLLRNSHFGIVDDSPPPSPTANRTTQHHSPPTAPESPTWRMPHQPEILPSPTESTTSTAPPASAFSQTAEVSGILFPPLGYQRAVQQMAHQSTLFNSRAVAALDHPDVSDLYVQRKAETRQQRAWKRSRSGGSSSSARGRVVEQAGSSQCMLCVLSALLLAAIVATYVILALTSTTEVTPTFHILFVLGILLATIVFAHTVVRLFVYSRKSRTTRRVYILPSSRSKHHRHHRHRQSSERSIPTITGESTPYVPQTPIQVHMGAHEDDVRPDSREAQPTATADLGTPAQDWNKDVEAVANPPPAYGVLRGSYRANPNLLHWQPVRSPVDVHGMDLPSPTYEEAMQTTSVAQRTGPPSYVARDSPARQGQVRDAGIGIDGADAHPQVVIVESAEPEMVEGRGIGLAA